MLSRFQGALQERWYKTLNAYPDDAYREWDALQTACVDAGFVETVAILTQNKRPDIEIATHECIASLIPLVKCASLAQRHAIFKQMMQHRLLDICLEVISLLNLVYSFDCDDTHTGTFRNPSCTSCVCIVPLQKKSCAVWQAISSSEKNSLWRSRQTSLKIVLTGHWKGPKGYRKSCSIPKGHGNLR